MADALAPARAQLFAFAMQSPSDTALEPLDSASDWRLHVGNAIEKESANAAQDEKLISLDPEVVAWQLAIQRTKNEQKKANNPRQTGKLRIFS